MENVCMLPIGTTLHHNRYRIDKHLGSGGFGNTYMVTDLTTGESLVMKEFFMAGINTRQGMKVCVEIEKNKEQFQTMLGKFHQEALRLQHIYNSHIVHVHDVFEENATAYYTMDFLQGFSLSDCMKCTGHPFEEDMARRILVQVLDALQAVHGQAEPLLHLDIKPSNIMFDSKEQNAYLIDFGAGKQIERPADEKAARSTALYYNPGYTPLEQLEQDRECMGPWTDFYALGATLYELLTEQKPPTLLDIQESGDQAFKFGEAISPETRQLILWLMQPDRRKRPQTSNEILQRVVGGKKKKGNKILLWFIGCLAVLILSLGIWLGIRSCEPQEQPTEVMQKGPRKLANPATKTEGTGKSQGSKKASSADLKKHMQEAKEKTQKEKKGQ